MAILEKKLEKAGYLRILVSADDAIVHLFPKRLKNGTAWTTEHRYIATKIVQRKLLKSEQVHHIDRNKLNNVPTNLYIVDGVGHHHYLECASGAILGALHTYTSDQVIELLKSSKHWPKIEAEFFKKYPKLLHLMLSEMK